jgi:hypothetical protein
MLRIAVMLRNALWAAWNFAYRRNDKRSMPAMPDICSSELVPKAVILSPALAVSQAKALRNRLFQGYSSKI